MIRLTTYSAHLCAVAAVSLSLSGMAQVKREPHAVAPHKAAPLSQKERAIQALDRFTFGPRPGDLERVEALGVGKWLDQELSPAKIDDSALETRLNQFPAMHLSSADLLKSYPPRAILREIEAGRIALPSDPVEHAIYVDALDKFRKQQEQKQTPQQKIGQEADALTSIPLAKDPLNAGMPSTPPLGKGRNADNQDVERLLVLSPAQRWLALLKEEPGALGSTVRNMKRPDREALVAGFTPLQKEALTAMVDVNRMVAGELLEERVLRAIYSNRQLNEVMTNFWLNHFNIYLRKNGEMPWLLATYERDAIRPHALGSFEQLLEAVAHSPAMLVYLDNQQSVGPDSVAAIRASRRKSGGSLPGLNENYARELMELHTLGVNGGYTQKDVTEVAKVFTGWGVGPPRDGGGFRFENRRHEPGTKIVLGRRISEGGEKEGLEVLHMLAESPATARFISTKLAMEFVSDSPPPALIHRMARRYVKTHGDIGQVLREMIKSRDFWSADAYHSKVKTPFEFVASAIRATNADVENASSWVQALDRLGMPLYGVQQPNGYSLKADPWLGSQGLLARFNFALALTANRLPGVEVMLPSSPGSDVDQETNLEQQFLNGPATTETRSAVMMQMDKAGLPRNPAAMLTTRERGSGIQTRTNLFVPAARAKPRVEDDKTAIAAALLLGSPEFQRR